MQLVHLGFHSVQINKKFYMIYFKYKVCKTKIKYFIHIFMVYKNGTFQLCAIISA